MKNSPLLWDAKYTASLISLVDGGSILVSSKLTNSTFEILLHKATSSIDFFNFLHVLPAETTS